ncbi:MAG: tail fiber domain-containing protein [bacterium]
MRHFFITHKKTFFAMLFVILFSTTISFADRANPYTAGETLDPDCAPGSGVNCTVHIAGGGGTQTLQDVTTAGNSITNDIGNLADNTWRINSNGVARFGHPITGTGVEIDPDGTIQSVGGSYSTFFTVYPGGGQILMGDFDETSGKTKYLLDDVAQTQTFNANNGFLFTGVNYPGGFASINPDTNEILLGEFNTSNDNTHIDILNNSGHTGNYIRTYSNHGEFNNLGEGINLDFEHNLFQLGVYSQEGLQTYISLDDNAQTQSFNASNGFNFTGNNFSYANSGGEYLINANFNNRTIVIGDNQRIAGNGNNLTIDDNNNLITLGNISLSASIELNTWSGINTYYAYRGHNFTGGGTLSTDGDISVGNNIGNTVTGGWSIDNAGAAHFAAGSFSVEGNGNINSDGQLSLAGGNAGIFSDGSFSTYNNSLAAKTISYNGHLLQVTDSVYGGNFFNVTEDGTLSISQSSSGNNTLYINGSGQFYIADKQNGYQTFNVGYDYSYFQDKYYGTGIDAQYARFEKDNIFFQDVTGTQKYFTADTFGIQTTDPISGVNVLGPKWLLGRYNTSTQSLNVSVDGTQYNIPTQTISVNVSNNSVYSSLLGSSNLAYSNVLGNNAGLGASGTYNNFLGPLSGFGTSASYSNFIGNGAGGFATNASHSNFIGDGAGAFSSSSSYSTFIGFHAGADSIFNPLNGQNNIIIGTNITLPPSTSNAINIGGVLFGLNTQNDYSANTAYFTAVTSGKIGIANANPYYTLDVGNSSVSGIVAQFTNSSGSCTISPTGSAVSCSSDINLKKNIVALKDNTLFTLNTITTAPTATTLDKLMTLTPVSYNWKTENDTDNKHTGFIAQQVEQVFPDLVTTDPTTNLKSLNYMGFAPYIVQAIQEMNFKMTAIIPDDLDATAYAKIKSFLHQVATDGEITFNTLKTTLITSDEIRANKTTTNQLCVGTTCIDSDQLAKMLQSANSQNTAPGTLVATPDTTQTPATPDPILAPTPDPAPSTPAVTDTTTPTVSTQ